MSYFKTSRGFSEFSGKLGGSSGLHWNLRLQIKVLMKPLELSFYACVCLHTRAVVCICASAYVGGLGSGTPEYTRWNVKCVFRVARGARNASQIHCNNFKWHDRSVCVCYKLTAGDRRGLLQGAPLGSLVTTTCVHTCKYTNKNTRNAHTS